MLERAGDARGALGVHLIEPQPSSARGAKWQSRQVQISTNIVKKTQSSLICSNSPKGSM